MNKIIFFSFIIFIFHHHQFRHEMFFKTFNSDYVTKLELAVEHIRENPGISQRQTCQIYGVARSTLQARLQGRQSTQTYHASTQRLSSNEEQVLITWIERMTSWGWPPRIQQFEYMVKELLMAKGDKAPLGDHYYQKFLKRHSEFSTKWKRNLDQVRKDAEQPAIFRHWFDLFLSIRTKHGIADEDIYNMDEKGFAMGIADSAKVIIKRGTMPFNVHAGNRDWVSLIECVSGCGRILSAYIIFPGKRIQDDWLNAITDGSITLQVSPNGWTDADIAVHWLKTVFHYHTKHSKGQFRLLLLDGHTSHISIEFIKFCEQMKIIALCLPPHSTHLLQPLDVGVFSPLNKTYKKLVSANSRYGAMNVTKIEFLDHIQKARKQAMMTTNVMGGWRGAGLIPYDPQHVLSKLLTPPDVAVASISTPTTPTTVRRIQDAVSGSGRLFLRALGGKASGCLRGRIVVAGCYASSCN